MGNEEKAANKQGKAGAEASMSIVMRLLPAAWRLSAIVGVALAFAQLTVQAADTVVTTTGKPKADREMCIGCHGIHDYKASFPLVYRVPMIAGQNAKYLEAALLAYKKGERSHPTMRAIAASLSEEDITALAAYYGQGKSN